MGCLVRTAKSMNVYLLLNQDHRETPKTAETRGAPRAVPMHHDANQPPKQQGRQGESSLLRGRNYWGWFLSGCFDESNPSRFQPDEAGPEGVTEALLRFSTACCSKAPSTQMHPCKPIEFYFL